MVAFLRVDKWRIVLLFSFMYVDPGKYNLDMISTMHQSLSIARLGSWHRWILSASARWWCDNQWIIWFWFASSKSLSHESWGFIVSVSCRVDQIFSHCFGIWSDGSSQTQHLCRLCSTGSSLFTFSPITWFVGLLVYESCVSLRL